MQDELIKHGKKIYETMEEPKHSFGEKFKKIIIEILIIVFAVSLSIWFHGWSEHRHEQKEVKEFLEDLKVDLQNDISDLKSQNELLQGTLYALRYFKSKETIDSIRTGKLVANNLTINIFPSVDMNNVGVYESFKSSGKIGLIENNELKKSILHYYQKIVPQKNYEQLIYNNFAITLQNELDTPPDFKQFIAVLLNSDKSLRLLNKSNMWMNSEIRINDITIKAAEKLIAEIEKDNK